VSELPFFRDRAEATVATPLALSELRAFDALLDARSPAEFAEDHLPGAINTPVLDDRERALVGTIYKEHSAFAAKRVGAPLVARNIARQIEAHFAARPRGWRALPLPSITSLRYHETGLLSERRTPSTPVSGASMLECCIRKEKPDHAQPR